MDLGTIMQLGNFAMGLFGSFSARNTYNRQAAHYEREAALNSQIGAFNAEVAERTGSESVAAIAHQTKKILGAQRNEFARRGISMEGSPMFVMGETITMGSKQAQEAYFNAQVRKTNALYASYGATATASANAERAHGGAMQENFNIFKQFKQGAQNLRSSMAIQENQQSFRSLMFGNSV